MLQLPIFDVLNDSSKVLIAGAGGGFDVYSGLPLYFALKDQGKDAFLANLTFADLRYVEGPRIAKGVASVTADSGGSESYFPELHLARWFREQGEEVTIYSFEHVGLEPVAEAYQALVDEQSIDTVVLVDGGTDSLMRGTEPSLATPEEDMVSIGAVRRLEIPRRILACLGFGVDTYHGVCHALALRAVSDLIRKGGYLGTLSLVREMTEVARFRDAVNYSTAAMPHRPSIVSTSIRAAIDGHFGDHHETGRTLGSELFISPLMSQYWFFDLPTLAGQVHYLDQLDGTVTFGDVQRAISLYRGGVQKEEWRQIPH